MRSAVPLPRHPLRDQFAAVAHRQARLQFAHVVDDGVRADVELCGDGVVGIALHPTYGDLGLFGRQRELFTLARDHEGGAVGSAEGSKTRDDINLPGWRCHALQGNLHGHWAVWVDKNWRLTFAFEGEDAVLVDYRDYH